MPAYNAGRGANLSGLASATQVTLSVVPASIAMGVPTAGAIVTNTGAGSVNYALVPTAQLSASPSSGTLAFGASAAITLTGSAISTQVLSVTNTSGGRSLGNPISIVVGDPLVPALTLSGPSAATATVASSNFTVVAEDIIAPIVVVPTNVVGTAIFSPTTVSPAPGDLTKLFTATWATAGTGRQFRAVAGDLVSNTVTVDVAPAPPPSGEALIMALMTPTPEQIGVRATWATSRTAGTTVRLQYKLPASSTWTDGPWLTEFLRSEVVAVDANAPGAGGASSESGLAVVDGFGGFAYHLLAGTAYSVRLAYTLPSSAVAYTTPQSYITRSLPAAKPAANKTCTTSTITAALAGLVPGDHLELQAGTYAPFTVSSDGADSSPIYISCAAGASVVYATADKIITLSGANNVVFDGMVITGTGVDNEAAYLASGGSLAGVYSTAFYSAAAATARITIRNSTITGIDVFVKGWAEASQWLIYNNTITGNNSHAVQYTVPPAQSLPNAGWNDTCINWHGNSNCAFNNTIQGFGDTVKFGFSTAPSGFESRGNHFYRNKVLRGADDCLEFDNSVSGSCYRNWVANVSNLASMDGCYEGPHDVFENVCINPGFDSLKLKGGSVNARFFHNTLVITNKNGTNHGLYTSNVTWHSRLRFQNNLIVYRGTGNAMHWSAPLNSDPLFDHNAWYSSTEDYFMSTPIYNSAGTLAEAKTVFAPRFAGDVATTSNPWSTTITLGANAQTEYTAGVFTVTLSGGATPLNAGTAIPGYNDNYTGAAPTIGAVWGGQDTFFVGQGTPALNLTAGVWRPNRDASGDVLQADFEALPTMQWVEVDGTNDTLRPFQESTLLTSGGAPDNNSLTNPWCGAAWDSARKRLIIQGGGHGDGHPLSNAIFEASAIKMKFARIVDRTSAAHLNQYDKTNRVFETWNALEWGYDGTPWPLANGDPSSSHTYHGLQYVPPATMVTLGYTGNVLGGLLTVWPYAICNLDTGTYNVPYFTSTGDLGGGIDLGTAVSWAAKFIDGTKCVFISSNSFNSRVMDLATPSVSRWSAEVGGALSFCSISAQKDHLTMPKNVSTLIRMPERREWAALGITNRTRIRVGTALDAGSGVTNWVPYSDSITLTSSDGSHADWNATNLDEDTRPVGKLCGAGSFYDHAAATIWVVTNTVAGGALYRITGIATNTWTTERLSVTPLYSEAGTLHNYHRFAMAVFGGVKVLIRVTGVDHPLQVCRVA